MMLSPHFSLEELTHSETAARQGIDNTPGPEVLRNLTALAQHLEEVRYRLANGMIITSGYRSPELNRAVGGSSTSQHMNGLAADFIAPAAGSPEQICGIIAVSAIPFDQLIWEHTWVHIGFGFTVADLPRRQIMTYNPATRTYTQGIAKGA